MVDTAANVIRAVPATKLTKMPADYTNDDENINVKISSEWYK